MVDAESVVSTEETPLVKEKSAPAATKTQNQWGNMWCIGSLFGQPIVIGPDICTLVCTYSFTIIPCVLFLAFGVADDSGTWMWATSVTVVVFTILALLFATLSDPGVLRIGINCESSEADPEDGKAGDKRRKKRYCNMCKLYQPPGSQHCRACKCCISGFDHHCPWMGKCVGERNLCYFYWYLAMVVITPAFFMISSIFNTPSDSSNAVRLL